MNDKISTYITQLFLHTVNSKEKELLKVRLTQQLQIAFDAECKKEQSEEEAFYHAVASIQALEDQVLTLVESTVAPTVDEHKKPRALLTSLGSGTIIFGVALFLTSTAFTYSKAPIIGLGLLLTFIAIGVTLIVYGQLRYGQAPTPRPIESKYASLFRTILYLGATIVYFLLSFSTGRWEITWIIWIIAALLEQIGLLLLPKNKEE